eukprot:TRINITY_DN13125_c0_g5_i1.p1 TRINITY_DN13125_c0_g5~~TRINITY_DN13125_c0_g5_i1.p1  ORF type:complete len:311 (+),score=47.14 TRINITY_DN13125_c0_g5_i1:46-978(+)
MLGRLSSWASCFCSYPESPSTSAPPHPHPPPPPPPVSASPITSEHGDCADDEDSEATGPRWLHVGDGRLPPLVEVPVSLMVAGQRLKALVKPPDPERLWEWYEARDQLDGDPSWAHVWPSAAALSGLLASEPSIVSGARVVELGAGLGVAGLTAALAGGRVTLLDREPQALHCAMASAQLNGIATLSVEESCSVKTGAGSVSAVVFDWSTSQRFHGTADVALASEVLYDPSNVAELAGTVVTLLGVKTRPGARLLLTDPPKERVIGCRAAFVQALEDTGARVQTRMLETPNLGQGLETAEQVVLIDAEWA